MNADNDGRGSRRWLWALAIFLVSASAFPIYYVGWAHHANARGPQDAAASTKTDALPNAVSCLGRIEPQDGVIHVAGAYIFGQPPVIEMLRVKEGDQVRHGTLIAILTSRRQLAAALEQAQARTAVARRRVEQVQAGVRLPDVAAQQSEISRLEASLQNAEAELRRYQTLRSTDDVTASELDTRSTTVKVARGALEQSRHRLENLKLIPESDVHVAEAQVQSAIADEERARRDYDLSAVYAPMDGQVLKIHAHAGEEAGVKGILDMGRTGHMYVVAEVYETDIGRVRPGQRATISGDLLGSALSGTVERIDAQVKAPSVVPGDTASFSDARIVEARIRLDRGEAVAGLMDGKVTVIIRP